MESLNRHLLTEKDEQQELVEFVQIEKEEFAKDLQSLKVNNPFRKTLFRKPSFSFLEKIFLKYVFS